MVAPFPLTPPPTGFRVFTTTKRGNVFLDSETPTFTMSGTVTGTYTVRDYYGTTIDTGSLSGATTLTPNTPAGGWKLGWYRLYLNGATNDAVFGTSLGVTNFAIVKTDSNFSVRPGRSADFSSGGESPDLALKGWLGIGTSRLQILDAAAPTSGSSDNIASMLSNITVSNTYWSTGGSHLGPDTARPRNMFVSFPNDAVDHLNMSGLLFCHKSGTTAAVGNGVNVVIANATTSGKKYTISTSSANMIFNDNSSFEGGVGSWTAAGTSPPTLAQSNTRAQHGTQSLRITYTGTLTAWGALTVTGLTNGTQYTASAYFYSPTGSPDVNFQIQGLGGAINQSTKNAWTRVTRTFTATGTSHIIQLAANSAVAGQVWWDAIQLETGASATTYVPAVSEVIDNVPATITGTMGPISTGSTLVDAYREDSANKADAISNGSGTLSNAKYLGVKNVVSQGFAQGVTWYEGSQNEPDIRKNPVRYANDARLFQAAVQAGNAGAKAMGPSIVSIDKGNNFSYPFNTQDQVTGLAALYRYLMGGAPSEGLSQGSVIAYDGPDRAAKNYLDGFATHTYNFSNGDMNIGKASLDNLELTLTAAGVNTIPRWQTEQSVITPVFGVYHPRRARWQIMHHLLMEQHGFPMARNNLWYDKSHGFWGHPSWWMNEDQSVEPQAVMLRVMAEEVYARPWFSSLDFGTGIGNRLFQGQVFKGSDGTQSVAVCATSNLGSTANVTLKITGTVPGTVNYRDAFGNQTTATVTDGLVSIPVAGEPIWVRLPNGAVPSVETFLGLHNRDTQNLADFNAWGTFNGSDGQTQMVDGQWMTMYDGNNTELAITPSPADATVRMDYAHRVSHVVVFAGMVWQTQAALLDFDIQTSDDGIGGWVTRKTVTRTASSFLHGSDFNNTGTQRDTFFDEQWVFPVQLDDMVKCKGVRVVVRDTTYGGEPDAAAITSGGQGDTRKVTISEVAILGDNPPQVAALFVYG